MLVTHLSTSDREGGAAIAAWRLHQGLRLIGTESRMVSRFRSGPDPDVSCIESDVYFAADVFNRTTVKQAQPPDATYFTVAPTTIPLMDHPWIAAADVVHLHWVAMFLSPEDIEQLCLAGKTVFWTFHDQWPYTGGCHYIGGDRRLEEDWNGSSQIAPELHPLVQLELLRKRQTFSSLPIHVIAPSRWMAREAAASGVFAAERIHVVPYGFDLSVYTSAGTGRAESHSVQRFDGITLAFGCQSLGDRRKGFQEFVAALRICMENPDFAELVRNDGLRMTTFGREPAGEMEYPVPATHLGTLGEETAVADVLRNSTAFICPTLDDNLPNVVVEALACGCPVLGFSTGGVPDMVTHFQNGLLAPRGDVAGLARHIESFCLDANLRLRLREGAAETDLSIWALETQARRMMDLYQSLGSPRQPQSGAAFPDAEPMLKLDGTIVPHFSTAIGSCLVGECRSLQSALKQRTYELNWKTRHDDALLAKLKAELKGEASGHGRTRFKLIDITEKLMEAQECAKRSESRVDALEQELARIRNSGLFRIWRFFRRKT